MGEAAADHVRRQHSSECVACGQSFPCDAAWALREASAAETDALVARLRDLLAGTTEVKPYAHGETVYLYCGKACKTVTHTVMVRPNSHMTVDLSPEKQYALCGTYGCTSMPKPPVRYRVTEQELAAATIRALPMLLDVVSRPATPSPTRPTS